MPRRGGRFMVEDMEENSVSQLDVRHKLGEDDITPERCCQASIWQASFYTARLIFTGNVIVGFGTFYDDYVTKRV